MKYFTNKYQIHCLFLFILSLSYLIPLLIFGQPTLFYVDTLDQEIVFNSVIGQFWRGNKEAVSLFLNGEIEPLYLRRIYHPYSYLYSLFDVEQAYWLIDILIRFTSYTSFYILAKKINKNIFFCCLVACLYASSIDRTHEGFGLAFFPYLIYLMIFKKSIDVKHYIIIFFFGLNTEILYPFLYV